MRISKRISPECLPVAMLQMAVQQWYRQWRTGNVPPKILIGIYDLLGRDARPCVSTAMHPRPCIHGREPIPKTIKKQTENTMKTKPDLKINFCGIEFENPFCLSSSPVGNHAEMCARAYDAGWGGIVYKTLGLEESFKVVMPSPRLSVYNYMDKRFVGLQNAEQITDRPIADNIRDIAWLKKNYPKKVLISSIMGYVDEDWIELATA